MLSALTISGLQKYEFILIVAIPVESFRHKSNIHTFTLKCLLKP